MGSHAALRLVTDKPDSCQRQNARFRVLLTAKLVTTTDEHPVKVRDLSSTGARLEGGRLPAPGTDVILRRGSLEAFATVMWRDGQQCGLELDEPLSEREILEQIKAPKVQAPRPASTEFRRPGFRGGLLTAEERARAREWAMPVGRQAYRD